MFCIENLCAGSYSSIPEENAQMKKIKMNPFMSNLMSKCIKKICYNVFFIQGEDKWNGVLDLMVRCESVEHSIKGLIKKKLKLKETADRP